MAIEKCVCGHKKEIHARPEHGGTFCNSKNCDCGNFTKKGLKCNICGRLLLKFKHNSKHHVMPVSIKKNNKTVILCKNCHSDLHTLFSVKELAEMSFKIQRQEVLKRIYPKPQRVREGKQK